MLKITRKNQNNLAVATIWGFVCTVSFANSLPKELGMAVDKKLATQPIKKPKQTKTKK